MATFLRTPRMSPELAARVEAAVRGRRAAPGARLAPRAVSMLRLGLVAGGIALGSSLALTWHGSKQELERERAALLETLARETSSLTGARREIPTRIKAWLEQAAGTFAGDFVMDELRDKDALHATLSRSVLYVRARQELLASRAGLSESAAASIKDAFVLCLLDPPSSRSEKALVGRARTAYAAGTRMREIAGDVHRLQPALRVLPLLEPAWKERVYTAENQVELRKLQRVFERAPLDAARRALEAEVLLFVIDEPAETNVPAELDGERPHAVRVGLVDLTKNRLLLRLRRSVDPSWLSEATRAEYAAGVDSCSLALDVRAALSGGTKVISASKG